MINLKGHSGCKVLLIEKNVVRKISSSNLYNQRLISQMDKQKKFSHDIIKTPRIIDSGITDDGNFYFDMEYIKGINLCEYFRKNSSNDCIKIIKILTNRNKNYKINIKNEIKEKLNSLKVNKEDHEMILSCDWIVDSGYCHGDLTFENIIISNSDLYLIDFLDSFVDAPIIDESKLLQDSFCYWSFSDSLYVPKTKLFKICELFDTKQHFCMLLVHLLRIIPYADQKKKEVVLCMMENVKNKINQF
jgi:tRNA A-37 threonylcarbamoyl transferase component Bud32